MGMDEIYRFLEDITTFDKLHYISFEIRKLTSSNTLSEQEQELVDTECAIFDIICDIGCSRKDWMDKAYDIIDSHLNYVEERANNTNNIILKAVYSEILFYSTNKKYKKYVSLASDSYIILLKTFHKNLVKNENNIYSLKNLIDKTTHLIQSANKNNSELKSEIKSIIYTCTKLDSKFIPLIKILIEVMIKYKKVFKKKDFIGIDDIFWNCIRKKIKEKEYQYVIDIIDLGKEIDKKLGKLSYPWIEEKCKCYENIIKQQTNPHIACSWCVDAIEAYRSMDTLSKRINNIEKIYTNLKDKFEFSSTNYKVDITNHLKYADLILNYEPIKIFHYLSFSKDLFPTKKALTSQKGFLTRYFTTVYLDNNSHPTKIENNEILNDLYLSNYRFIWQDCEIIIQKVFIDGIKNKKITLQSLISYLLDYSCFFDIQIKKSNGKRIKYNWSSSIIRIFEIYFNEMELSINNPKKYYPHLVEITDSLVLRFEALLRLYLDSHKEPSITTKVTEPHIIREKDINTLLYDDFIIKKFTFEDLLYFRYLFVAHQGYNLRNDIAHSLLIPNQYTVELFNLVFFAFLRLSKYYIPNTQANHYKKLHYPVKYTSHH